MESQTPTTTRLARWVTLAVLVAVAVGATLLFAVFQRSPGPAAESRAQSLAHALDESLQRADAALKPAIAVLPFNTPEGDEDLGLLGDALCDALLERLTRARALRTSSCNASRIAVQVGMDDAEIGHLLGAERLVRGSLVRADGNAYRVQASLQEARGGSVLAQIDQRFDESSLQELPARVVEQLTAAQADASAAPQAASGRAFRLYLRSVALSRRGGVDNKLAARDLIDESLALDPDYAPAVIARVALASQLVGLGVGNGAEVDDMVKRAGAHLARVDPEGPQALMLAATAAVGQRHWREGYERIARAAENAPHYAPALHTRAGLLMMMGYLEQARQVALDVARLEPLVGSAHERLARAHALLGDDTRMVESAELARELGYTAGISSFIGLAALRRGDAAAATQGYEASVKLVGAPTEWIAPMMRAAVDPDRRDAALAAFDAVPQPVQARLNEFFLAYAMAGAPDRALQALQRMSTRTATMWAADVWLPEMAAVRRLPAFADYVESVGLAALWDAHGEPDRCRRQADGRYRCQ